MMDFRLKYSTTLILLIPAWLFSQTNIDFGTVNEKSSSTKSLNYDATNFPTGSNDSVYAYFTLMGVGWFIIPISLTSMTYLTLRISIRMSNSVSVWASEWTKP